MDLPDDMKLDDDHDNDNQLDGDGGSEGGSLTDQDEQMPIENVSEQFHNDPIDENELPKIEYDLPDEKDISDPDESESLVDQDIPDESELNTPANGLNEEEKSPLPEENQEAETQPMDLKSDMVAQQPFQPYGVEGKDGDQATESKIDDYNQNTINDSKAEHENDENVQESFSRDNNNQSTHPKASDEESSQQQHSNEANPHRSVGNATEKWQSRLRNISDSIEDRQKSKDKDIEGKEFEFVQEDHEDQGETQALGIANQEQIDAVDNTALTDESKEDKTAPPIEENIDIVDPESSPLPRNENTNPSEKEQKGGNGSFGTVPEKDVESDDESSSLIDNMITDETIEEDNNIPSMQDLSISRKDAVTLDAPQLDLNEGSSDTKDYYELRRDSELRIAEWRQNGSDPREAQDMWRNYSMLTRDLAFTLCEQLRLILEPTLATKLKGDYRSGKRLNMRKIVSYIASEFKKDKIWMRRTKPSKRTYQVMISIDDSRSMAESHSVQMAFESLTIISKALTQLEVGDICITSFGEDVKLIHPFESVFSDESGADVIRSFSFSQEVTDVKLLMDQSLSILQTARSKQSLNTGDLWQLQVILSDGKCENHEYIQSRVRAAAEERIAVVFIILDTRSEKQSILAMDTVSYDVDPITLKPTLKMTRYMDTFPFDYFVVVRNVEKLPEVLSETLRQFFAFVSGN